MENTGLYGLESEEFVLKYRNALAKTDTYHTVDDVRNLILELIDKNESVNKGDYLVDFIQKSLEENVALNRLTGQELIDAGELKIPGAKIINDSIKVSQNISYLLDGLSYYSDGRMIAFRKEKLLLFDIEECSLSDLSGYNEEIISRLEESKLRLNGNPIEVLENCLYQARSLSCDY